MNVLGYNTWRTASPQEPEEPPEYCLEQAEIELASNHELLYNVLTDSPWIDEYTSYLFDHCQRFRQEAVNNDPIALKQRAWDLLEQQKKWEQDQ